VTRKDRLFKIHYADGRVDGPLSTQVVRDLIQVQAISPSDLLTADGEPLRPYTQIPDFADLAQLASSAGAASSGVKVRRTTNLPPIQRVTGANPVVGAGPRITGSVPAVGGAITQFPGAAGGSNPGISLRGGSNPGIPAGPATWGNTPTSNPGIPAGGFAQPVRGASNPGFQVGGPMIARRFPPEMIALGPVNLRDKLLVADLAEILGLSIDAPVRLWKQACYDRALQVKNAFSSPKDTEEKLATVDVISILLASQEVLCDPSRAGGYLQARGSNGRPLSFQNYSFQGQLNFSFAEEGDLYKLSRQLDARLAALGVIASPEEQPPAPTPGPISGSMPQVRAPLVVPPPAASQPSAPSLPPGFSSQPLTPSAPAGGLRPMQPAGGLRPMAAPPSMMNDDDDLGDKTLTVDAASLGFFGLGAQPQADEQLGDDDVEVMASIPGHQDEPLRRAPASSPGLAARLAHRHSGASHIAADTPSGDGVLESPEDWITDGDLPALDDLVPMTNTPSGALGAVMDRAKTTRELDALRVRSTQDIPALSSLPQRFVMPDEWLKASAEDLRDRLLVSNLYGNLGVDVNSPPEDCSEAYQVRIAQIQEKYQPMFLAMEQQLVLTDVIEILYRSCAILIDPEARPTYVNQTPPPSFQNFVKFSFADESLFSTAGQIRRARRLGGPPGRRAVTNEMREVRLSSGQAGAVPEGGGMGGLRAAPMRGPEVEEVSRVINYTDLQAAAANLAQLQASKPTGQMPMMGMGGGTSPKTTSTIPAQGNPTTTAKGPATALSVPKVEEQKAPPPKKPPAKQTPRSKEEEEKRRRREMFKGGGQNFNREEGDPFKGPLAFGVGDNARALKHTVPVAIVGFGLCFLAIEGMGLGKKELSLDPNEQMLFVRPAIYILLALVGLVIVRRESIARIGLMPKIIPAVIALPFGLLMGFIAKTMARFDVEASAQMPKLIPFLLLRAFGESVFFQGYLNRTALIEFQTPPLAVFLTSVYFGLFTLSYSALLGASTMGGMFYSVLIYTFGMGFPIAFIYAQTRSILVTTICQFFVYYMAALGGLERAKSILGNVVEAVP
jgi:hypothetical protein